MIGAVDDVPTATRINMGPNPGSLNLDPISGSLTWVDVPAAPLVDDNFDPQPSSIADITASRGAFEGSGNRREAGNNIGVSGAYLKPVTLFFDDVFRASQDQSSYFPIDVDLDCLPLWPKYHAGHEDNFKIGNADACLTFVDKAKWCEVTRLAVKYEKRPLVWLNFQSLWRHEAARGLSCPINNTFYTSTAFNKSAYNPRLHIPVPTPTFQNYRYPTSTSDVLARCREAKLLASFYGQIATEERKEIVRAFRNVSGTSVLDSGGYGAGGARMYELLLDSKFGLVPAGDGWHSYRLVEVMAMGVVPVVLSSQWILPFESSLDWKSFAIDARDTSLQKLPSLLRSELPRACDMGAKAYGVYHEYMATPSAIVRGIQKHVNAFSTP
ncbi:glycosyltransferase family 47 protein [Pseudoscourfieldia marina]